MKQKKKGFNKDYILNTILGILGIICLVSICIFSYYLFKINIIPTKYLIMGFTILGLILLLIFILTIKKKNRILKCLGLMIIVISTIASIYSTGYLRNTYEFLNNMVVNKYSKVTLSLIVLKDSNINNIKDLEDKSIAYLKNDYNESIKEELKNKITYKEVLVDEFGILPDMLTNKEVEGIILEESFLNLIKEEIPEFENNIKIIKTFEIKIKSHKEESNIEINESPFILYISGIDRYGSISSVRGRSDVNQIVVVNPKTNKILLLNTPRDYYVQLHGTTGLKDKLTHAGIYGIERSITTLEDLYNIDINYYLRVNFDTLEKIVNAIDGIDIYSDKSFRAHTNKNVYVKEGWNHFNGAEALAYARERYAYINGDNHRGANQQQVITAIIDKVSSSKVLISKYNNILTSLNGSFETDMPLDILTSFIKKQINDMGKWEIESIAVTGYNSSNYTYSMGSNYKLYVMEPNWDSVNNAKNKINEVLNEE